MKPPVRNAIAVTVGIAATVLLVFAVEGLAGWYLFSARKNAGLIWPPDSTVEHATPEFHYAAHINNLGFRDRDFARRKAAGPRIAVLGDSFTYGWGLSAEQSYRARPTSAAGGEWLGPGRCCCAADAESMMAAM